MEHLLEREALERRPSPRVTEQRAPVGDLEEAVEQPGVPQVHLRGLDLPLADVLVPRLQLPDHERPGEDVEVGAHRLVRESHRPRQLRGVPRLAVVVRQHRPEPAHGAAGTPIPSWGTSRSRKVRMKPSRQARLSPLDRARNDRGSPPLSHNLGHEAGPVSRTSNPESSTNSTRPARVSETPRTMSGDALPSTRNRAGLRGRSTRTRSTPNSSGLAWISSRITSPRSAPRTSSGFCSRRRSGWDSRSNTAALRPSANARANVVLPHWRGPSRAVTGDRRTAVASLSRDPGRSITSRRYHESSESDSEISRSSGRPVLPGGESASCGTWRWLFGRLPSRTEGRCSIGGAAAAVGGSPGRWNQNGDNTI